MKGRDRDQRGSSFAGGAGGHQPGDIITQVGESDVETAKQAVDALGKQDASKGIRLSITNRQGSRFVLLRQEEK